MAMTLIKQQWLMLIPKQLSKLILLKIKIDMEIQ